MAHAEPPGDLPDLDRLTLSFTGLGATLQIVPGAGATPFNDRVPGVTTGDTIDLAGMAATGTNSGSTLTLRYDAAGIGTVTFTFDPIYDLAKNPDVAAAGINPLAHYEASGWKGGRDPPGRVQHRQIPGSLRRREGRRNRSTGALRRLRPFGGTSGLLGLTIRRLCHAARHAMTAALHAVPEGAWTSPPRRRNDEP